MTVGKSAPLTEANQKPAMCADAAAPGYTQLSPITSEVETPSAACKFCNFSASSAINVLNQQSSRLGGSLRLGNVLVNEV